MTINVFGGGNSSAPVFPVQRSVRLRSSNSAYFNRTLTTPTNNKIFTWSGWIKRGALGATLTYPNLFSTSIDEILFYSATYIDCLAINFNGATGGSVITTQVFRDPSAWYHIVISVDTTQATASNRVKIYVNGVQVTAFNVSTYPALNYSPSFNSAVSHALGQSITNGRYFDGYLTEVNFIDGQALTPTSFGSINSSTGVWQPIKYSGTYGTNGFYLNFQDNSAATAAAIGKDSSGNGNNWTPNNISVTAGVTYDSMVDVPTLTGAENANFCTGNPLNADGSTWSSGNLNFSLPNSTNNAQGTVSVTSGKWYWEVVYSANPTQTGVQEIGLRTRWTSGVVYASDGTKYVNGTNSSYGASYTNGDVIGVALDMDASTVTFYKNNTSQGSISLTGSGCVNATFTTSAGGGTTSTGSVNFGQRPFSYPPTGFKSLNTYNLPDSTIPNGATQFAATNWTSNGSTQTVTNTVNGKSFQPDLVWNKARNLVADHALTDSVRGISVYLRSNTTNADTSAPTYLTSLNADGFSLGAANYANGTTLTAWQWKAGGTAVTNTSGSISSQVSANPSAGFSIVTYTGTGANATVGHGLGVAPKMVIVKRRDAVMSWAVWQTALAGTEYLLLDQTQAKATAATVWNSTTPTSTVFSIGTNQVTNLSSSATYVAYCFSEIAGFSKFGSYTGNGATDGPFIYTGFKPRFVMMKRTDTTGDWVILDSSRSTYNAADARLWADLSSLEVSNTGGNTDFLSNGFKLRNTNVDDNASSGTYVYAAFSENPFKNSLAR